VPPLVCRAYSRGHGVEAAGVTLASVAVSRRRSAPGLPRLNLLCMGLFCTKIEIPSPQCPPAPLRCYSADGPEPTRLARRRRPGADSPGRRSETPTGSRTIRSQKHASPTCPPPPCPCIIHCLIGSRQREMGQCDPGSKSSSSLSDLSDNPLISLKLRILPPVKRSSNINELEFL
jgi:hypothetical protein